MILVNTESNKTSKTVEVVIIDNYSHCLILFINSKFYIKLIDFCYCTSLSVILWCFNIKVIDSFFFIKIIKESISFVTVKIMLSE